MQSEINSKLERAEEFMRAAELSLSEGLFWDSDSRSYTSVC